MLKHICLLLILIVTNWPTLGAAKETPEWASSYKAEDAKYRYYVGRSDQSETESVAVQIAFENALEAAIVDNFGLSAEIQVEGYQTESGSSVLKRVRRSSRPVSIQGFEKVDSYLERSDRGYNARTLFRYDKMAIYKEKIRQAEAPVLPTSGFSEIDGTDKNKGGLTVISHPTGARVFLNGDPYGITPFRMSKQLDPGLYSVTVDHPYYLTKEERVMILPGAQPKVNMTLERAQVQINVKSEPSIADVLINNKLVGQTPVTLKVFAGEKFNLGLKHEEAFPQDIQNMILQKNESFDRHFKLQLRTGTLVINTTPKSANIYINNSYLGNGRVQKALDAGLYEVSVTAPEYETKTMSLRVRPNKIVAESFKLEKAPEKP